MYEGCRHVNYLAYWWIGRPKPFCCGFALFTFCVFAVMSAVRVSVGFSSRIYLVNCGTHFTKLLDRDTVKGQLTFMYFIDTLLGRLKAFVVAHHLHRHHLSARCHMQLLSTASSPSGLMTSCIKVRSENAIGSVWPTRPLRKSVGKTMVWTRAELASDQFGWSVWSVAEHRPFWH